MPEAITRAAAIAVAHDARESGRPELAARILAMAPRRWRAERHDRDPSAIVIGSDASTSYGQMSIVMINPTCKQEGVNRYHREAGAYVLQFGAHGTALHCYASGLEDALEQCAAWLAEYAPGHIMAHGSDEHTALCREAFEDAGLAWTGAIDWEDQAQSDAMESAEADLTYTESGYLTSYEWMGSRVDSVEALYRMIAGYEYARK